MRYINRGLSGGCGLWQKARVKSTWRDFHPWAAARRRPVLTVGHPTRGLYDIPSYSWRSPRQHHRLLNLFNSPPGRRLIRWAQVPGTGLMPCGTQLRSTIRQVPLLSRLAISASMAFQKSSAWGPFNDSRSDGRSGSLETFAFIARGLCRRPGCMNS